MSIAGYLASAIATALFGAIVGAVLYAMTGDSFWIGSGAAIAMVAWLAARPGPSADRSRTHDRRLIFGIAVAAGVTAGLALMAATAWGFWIGVGLSAGLLLGWLAYARR